jgi:hypothetical protein
VLRIAAGLPRQGQARKQAPLARLFAPTRVGNGAAGDRVELGRALQARLRHCPVDVSEHSSDARTRPAALEWALGASARRAGATYLFRNGLNAKQVQMWLGHHSPAFTLATYVHLLPDDLPDPKFLDEIADPAAEAPVARVNLPDAAFAVGSGLASDI